MALLATNSATTVKPRSKNTGINWLKRLALLKLVYWRLGDDTFAIEERITRAQEKLEKLEEGTQAHDDLFIYIVNLELVRDSYLRRRGDIQRYLAAVAVYNLSKQEYAWWQKMVPSGNRIHIPAHMQYFLGTTEKSSVAYERLSGPRLDANGHILWKYNPSCVTTATDLSRAYNREFSYGPLNTLEEVEQELAA